MVSLLELGENGGFRYGTTIGVGEGCWLRIWYFFGDEEVWWLRKWYLYLSWRIVVPSYTVSLLELGKSVGFVYGKFIGVGE